MKKAFEGGWDECMKLKELKVSDSDRRQQLADLLLAVPARDTDTRQHYPAIRLIPDAFVKRAILCIRMHGGQLISAYKVKEGSTARSRACRRSLQADASGPASYTPMRFLPSRYEA